MAIDGGVKLVVAHLPVDASLVQDARQVDVRITGKVDDRQRGGGEG
jgi:hypothetical protein